MIDHEITADIAAENEKEIISLRADLRQAREAARKVTGERDRLVEAANEAYNKNVAFEKKLKAEREANELLSAQLKARETQVAEKHNALTIAETMLRDAEQKAEAWQKQATRLGEHVGTLLTALAAAQAQQ